MKQNRALICRFADLDPFARSRYFGWNLDLVSLNSSISPSVRLEYTLEHPLTRLQQAARQKFAGCCQQGVPLKLGDTRLQGQFTRFQRVFHIRPFCLLLRHRSAECLSSLQASLHMCTVPVINVPVMCTVLYRTQGRQHQ